MKEMIEFLVEQFIKAITFFFLDEFLIKLKHHLSHNLWDVPKVCQVSLLAMSRYNVKNRAVFLSDNLEYDRNLHAFSDIPSL